MKADLPRTEDVADDGSREAQNTATTSALNDTAREEHLNVDRQGTDKGSDEKDDDAYHDDWLR